MDKIYNELLQIADNRNIIVIDHMLRSPRLKGLYRQDGEIQAISLNVSLKDNPEERNFTLAHELGHAALHKGKINETLYFNDKNYKDKLEQEANNYAYILIDTIKKKISTKLMRW